MPLRYEAPLRTPRACAIFCALLLTLANPAQSQNAAVVPDDAPVTGDAATPATDAPPELVELSLRDAILRGLENNLDVEIARAGPELARFDHRAAWGNFDPVLRGNYNSTRSQLPTTSTFQTDADEHIRAGTATLSGLLPLLGWSYDIRYEGSSRETTPIIIPGDPGDPNAMPPVPPGPDIAIQPFRNAHDASVTSTLTAPVLRGFLWGPAWVEVRRTGLGREVARETFRRQLMDTVARIESGYWNLASRLVDFEVAQKSLETAQLLRDQTDAQFAVGTVSRVEVIEAEAGVADREYRLIQTENRLQDAQDQLYAETFGAQLRAGARVRLRTSDSPHAWQKLAVDELAAVEKAYALRPELAEAAHQTEQLKLQARFAFNQRLPQVDLVAQYGTHGIAGTDADGNAISTEIGTHYRDTEDYFFKGARNRRWSRGVTVSIPFGNTSARNKHRRARAELAQAQVRTQRLEQNILLEVRRAVRNLRSAIRGIEAAERRVAAASEQLRAEQVRLEFGESTPFAVLQREEDRVEAESQRTSALQIYHESVAGLNRAQGTILRDHDIALESALYRR